MLDLLLHIRIGNHSSCKKETSIFSEKDIDWEAFTNANNNQESIDWEALMNAYYSPGATNNLIGVEYDM